jgi:hypothetical protein
VTADRRELVVEIAATVLLAFAAIATAWSSYQASQWHGEQAVASGRATAMRVESTRASDEANRQVQIDVSTFSQWIDAYARGDRRLAGFYRRRFRPEFRPAFEAWIASRPLRDPDAQPTPFTLPEYRLSAQAEADRLQQDADDASAEVQTDVDHADVYVLAVVLFATALALAGIGARLKIVGVRLATIALGWALFIGAVAWILTLPVDV